MKPGAKFLLTDGKGNLFETELIDDHKKAATVNIVNESSIERGNKKISIAVSLIKNNSRLEWFLEKATELGVNEIIPLICARTEKQHFRLQRMNSILISAMLQSQQCWLPALHEPMSLNEAFMHAQYDKKFIAHCEPQTKYELSSQGSTDSAIILIGPEGDFTPAEIAEALSNGFTAVSLGNTRLRTETAALVSAVLLTV